MKKTLPIGTVAKMVGMSPEALRFYERKKIIDSFVGDVNGYRQYERPIVTHLLKARYLKSMGFSLPEVNEQNSQGIFSYHGLMSKQGVPLDEWLSNVKERERQLKLEIQQMEKVLSKVEDYRRQVQRIQSLNGSYRIEMSPEMLYLNFSNESDEMPNTQEFINEAKQWVDLFPISRYSFLCSKDMLSLDTCNLKRGLCIPLQEALQLGVCVEDTRIIRSTLCLHTIVSLDVNEAASTNMMRNAVNHISKHNYTIVGDAFGMWIANARETNCYIKYFEIWIPISED